MGPSGSPDSLRCVQLVEWPDNPYQRLLAAHLGALDIQVEQWTPRIVFLPRNIRQWRPHILHVQDASVFAPSPRMIGSLGIAMLALVQLLILRLLGVRIVWTIHDLKHHEKRRLTGIDRAVALVLSRLVDAIITHCDTAGKLVAAELRISKRNKMFSIPHGNFISTYENTIEGWQARRDLRIAPESTVLLCLGLIRPYKGLVELIEAFRQVEYRDAHLIIAGRPVNEELSERIQAQVQGMRNVTYRPGYIPDEQVQVYMNAADAVVFAYRDILTSGTLVLAMSFGRACIAPRRGCIPDLLDTSGGFLYEGSEDDGLVTAIGQAVARRADLQAMGEHNRRVAERWTWDLVATMTREVYQRCLSGRRSSGA